MKNFVSAQAVIATASLRGRKQSICATFINNKSVKILFLKQRFKDGLLRFARNDGGRELLRKFLIFFVVCCMLTSCGQSGHLYLPADSSNNATPAGK